MDAKQRDALGPQFQKLRLSGLVRTSSSESLNIDPYRKSSPVFSAVANKTADVVETLLRDMSEAELFHSLNQLTCELDDDFELSLLSVAVIEDKIETIGVIVKMGADPNGNHYEPCPPLFYVSSVGALEALLACGAQVNRPGIFNTTPLLQAVKNFLSTSSDADLAIVKRFVEAGSDPSIVAELPSGEKESVLQIVRASDSDVLQQLFASFSSV